MLSQSALAMYSLMKSVVASQNIFLRSLGVHTSTMNKGFFVVHKLQYFDKTVTTKISSWLLYVATLGEQRAHTPSNSIALDLVLTLASSSLRPSAIHTNNNIPCDKLPSRMIDWCHSATISHEKSFQAFPLIFLQSCKTKSGTESLGLRLVSDHFLQNAKRFMLVPYKT